MLNTFDAEGVIEINMEALAMETNAFHQSSNLLVGREAGKKVRDKVNFLPLTYKNTLVFSASDNITITPSFFIGF